MKFCTKCGSSIDDNAVVCPNCGCPVEGSNAAAAAQEPAVNQAVEQVVSPVTAESQPQQQYQQQPYQQQAQPVVYENNPKKKIMANLSTLDLLILIANGMGALLGIASIICGIVFRIKFTYKIHLSSLGDASYLVTLTDTVANGLCILFILLGILLIFYFAVKILENIKSQKKIKS